jgi:hypothetical protein
MGKIAWMVMPYFTLTNILSLAHWIWIVQLMFVC